MIDDLNSNKECVLFQI